ncbi:MAG: FkbM family methyltransferase, partial [Bacteroidota bacterium]
MRKINLAEILASNLVLFDAGAKGGTKELNKLAFLTKVFAFEPYGREAELLRKNKLMQKNFMEYSVHQVALADEDGFIKLNIMNNTSMNSMLDPDFENYQLHFGMMNRFPEWKNNIEVQETISVDGTAIESFCDQNKISQINFLKLDTQGTELKILNGAKKLFDNHSIGIIKCEFAFVPVYKEQCLFADIDIFLRQHDMRFVDCLFYENTIYQKARLRNPSPLRDASRYSSGGDAIYIVDIEKVESGKRKEIALKSGMILAELNYKSIAFDFLHTHAQLEKTTAIDLVSFLSA